MGAGAGIATGGGGLSGGSSGPATSGSRGESSFDNAFNVSFGGNKWVQVAPFIVLGLVAVAWIVSRK